MSQYKPTKLTTDPITTGASVIGIKYKDGVFLAADTLVSYGGMARFMGVSRIAQINRSTMIASSGEYSDFQQIVKTLKNKQQYDQIQNYGVSHLGPSQIGQYLTRLKYHKRSKIKPLFNRTLVAGVDEMTGKSHLQIVDLFGTTWSGNFLLSGFAQYLCQVLCQNEWHQNMSEQEARDLIVKCMTVLYYRDSRASEEIQIARVDANGVQIMEPFNLKTKWDYEAFRNQVNQNHTKIAK